MDHPATQKDQIMAHDKTKKHFNLWAIVVAWLVCASAIFWGMTAPSNEGKEDGRDRCPNVAPSAAERQLIEDKLNLFRAASPGYREPGSVKIPVYVHIITDAKKTTGDVSDEVVYRQIDVLNAAFSGRDSGGAGANTPFRFELLGIDRTPNEYWFNMVYRDPNGYERAAKAALNQGGKGTLNIYTAKVEGRIYGWARFPWDPDPTVDGVVVRYSTLPYGSTTNFNEGDTVTHEVAHWLGLFHTFEGNCYPPGDSIADTPPGRNQATRCPSAFDSCPSQTGYDAIHNFMNFVYDSCMYNFTRNQSERMDDMHRLYRQ
jgi:hypothetical protein